MTRPPSCRPWSECAMYATYVFLVCSCVCVNTMCVITIINLCNARKHKVIAVVSDTTKWYVRRLSRVIQYECATNARLFALFRFIAIERFFIIIFFSPEISTEKNVLCTTVITKVSPSSACVIDENRTYFFAEFLRKKHARARTWSSNFCRTRGFISFSAKRNDTFYLYSDRTSGFFSSFLRIIKNATKQTPRI